MNKSLALDDYFSNKSIILVAFLFIQHIFLFNQQYFNGVGFGNDFFKLYHAVPYYWMINLRLGIFPEWVPYQAMGYPLQMNLQSGLFYPPFYIFPLLGINYTLQVAVIFQCLHVLLGTLGVFYLARSMKLGNYASFLAAAAYQLFGGFYSGAAHSDMVRSWSFLPWLLMAFYIPVEQVKFCLRRNIILVPILFAFLFTGGYPSIAITACFMTLVFLAAQLLVQKASLKEKLFVFFTQSLLTILGIGLASVHLLPAFLMRSELERYGNLNKLNSLFSYIPLSFHDLVGLFLPSSFDRLSTFHHIPAMFIGLPMVFFLFMILKEQLSYVYMFIVMAVLSIVMGMGANSILYNILKAVFPPLGYSKYPIADYKGFLAISLIIISAVVINKWLENPELFAKNSFIIRGAIFLFIFFGICSLYELHTIYQAEGLLEANFFFLSPWIFFLLLLFIFYGWITYKEKLPQLAPTIVIFLLMTFHGYYVHQTDSIIWCVPNLTKVYESFIKISFKDSEEKLIDSLARPIEKRPQRLISKKHVITFDTSDQKIKETIFKLIENRPQSMSKTDTPFSWSGYIKADFIMVDYVGGMNLARQKRLGSNLEILNFLGLPSETLLFDSNFLQNNPSFLPENWTDFLSTSEQVSIKSFQANFLEYDINITSKKIMIENETFFNGWKGLIVGQGEEKTILPIEVVGGLRGWELPEGKYSLKLTFTMPYLRTGALISIIAIVFWGLIILGVLWKKTPKIIKETEKEIA